MDLPDFQWLKHCHMLFGWNLFLCRRLSLHTKLVSVQEIVLFQRRFRSYIIQVDSHLDL